MKSFEQFPIVIHRPNEKTTVASIPQLSLYAKGENINAALAALEAKKAALAAELEEVGDLEAFDGAPLAAVERRSILVDSQNNLGQFLLKTGIVVAAIAAIVVFTGIFIASGIQGTLANVKLGGAPLWMRVEQELDRMARPDSDLPEEKKQKLLADIRAIGARWRPFLTEIRSALASSDNLAASAGPSCK